MASLVERLRAGLEPPRTLSFTRTGTYFVLMTLGVGIAAINTGNNLLFLLLGMMLSVIVASGVLSEAVLRRLEVRRELPPRIVAGRPAAGHLEVENPKAWPSLSVGLREADVECTVGPLAGARAEVDRTPWWNFWADDGPRDLQMVASAYFLRIEGDSSERSEAPYEFGHRGVYKLRDLRLVTRFPFHLFEKARDIRAESTTVVYPKPRPASEWLADLRAGTGDVASGEAGRGDEYFGLREYRPGEDRRLIHWKRSAARGELVVKEQEDQTTRSLVLHVCNARGGALDAASEAAFETALERGAGLVQAVAREDWDVGLRTVDREIAPRESTDLDRLFRTLARTELHSELPERGFSPDPSGESTDVLVAYPDLAAQLSGDWDRVLPIESDSDGE